MQQVSIFDHRRGVSTMFAVDRTSQESGDSHLLLS